jgi:DNA-binding GntR family transcriptional regulator
VALGEFACYYSACMQNSKALSTANGDEPLDGGASTRHAYEQLRSKILLGELEPGATFSQVQLAAQLGVSRTPLREAVRLLQTEALLDSEPNRQVRVSPLTTDDFEDLYAMRITLDSLAVRLTVPRLSDTELAEIRMRYLETTAASAQGDAAAYREPHRRFHFGLFAHAGARLVREVQDLWDHAERYRRLQTERAGDLPTLVRLGQREHAAILEAAEARDAALAGKRMAEHLARTALTTLVQTDARHDPARVRTALEHVYAEDPVPARRATPAATITPSA